MNVVDVIIIALLILGGVAGFKAGVIKKLTDFIGMFVVIILAFYLKNYISVIMYENLPFFNFFGLINGIDALNILLYEVIAFLVIFIALLFVLKVVLMLTGLVEKILTEEKISDFNIYENQIILQKLVRHFLRLLL